MNEIKLVFHWKMLGTDSVLLMLSFGAYSEPYGILNIIKMFTWQRQHD